ncbi:MAG: hypothetical protein WA020_10950 [Candidatus Acidiferrales bacterium]
MHSFASTATLSFCLLFAAAIRGQTSQTLNAAGEPPKILNIVHQTLIPGNGSAYGKLLESIANAYEQAKIPVYWLQAQSLTGSYEAMSLNFFDSFAEVENAANALAQVAASSPALGPMQEQLLGYVSSNTNAIAVRRDDLGYRADAIDFSKARILRVATIHVRQGHEEEFAEAIKGLRAAYAKLNADAPWATYQVNAGAPATTFVILLPMHSLKEMDDYIERTGQLRAAEGETVYSRLQEIARNAYIYWDSELYVVSATTSHVPDDFAAGDLAFWKSAQR